MPLTFTDLQVSNFFSPLDTALNTVFTDGAQSPSFPSLLAGMPKYPTFTSKIQQETRDTFRQVFAAWLTTTQGITTTVNYLKNPSGSGTLTFVNGILTAST